MTSRAWLFANSLRTRRLQRQIETVMWRPSSAAMNDLRPDSWQRDIALVLGAIAFLLLIATVATLLNQSVIR